MQYYLYCQPQESQEYKLGEELRRAKQVFFRRRSKEILKRQIANLICSLSPQIQSIAWKVKSAMSSRLITFLRDLLVSLDRRQQEKCIRSHGNQGWNASKKRLSFEKQWRLYFDANGFPNSSSDFHASVALKKGHFKIILAWDCTKATV